VTRAPSERPEGLAYEPELLSDEEERGLLASVAALAYEPIVIRGRAARRVARHYGLGYDYEARTPGPGEPLPEWLLPVRERAAALAGVEPDDLVEALVQRYPAGATIGWHRDAPAFGVVVGISLGGACRLRFRRGTGAARRTWELVVEPRSGYVLAGEARSSWQHSIPATKEERYSITFRTLR
jgi:alkylated DNA repair dioxygenase AlkB